MGSDRDGLDWLRFLQLEVQGVLTARKTTATGKLIAKKTTAAWEHPAIDRIVRGQLYDESERWRRQQEEVTTSLFGMQHLVPCALGRAAVDALP